MRRSTGKGSRHSGGKLCGQHWGHTPELSHPGERSWKALLQLLPFMRDCLAAPGRSCSRAEQSPVEEGIEMYTEWRASLSGMS